MDLGRGEDLELEAGSGVDRCKRSREQLEVIVGWLGDERSGGLEHSDVESRLVSDRRELLRVLFQDHLDLRTEREQRVERVADRDGSRARRSRLLTTVRLRACSERSW